MYNITMDRFWDKVVKTDECWIWTGAKSSSGYGHLNINKKTIKAHRYSYEMFFGKIEHDKIIMHKCDTPLCVNPEHLSVGTKKENSADMATKKRAYNQKKKTCPKGHKYTKDNTYIFTSPSTGKSRRQCKSCMVKWDSYNRWNKTKRKMTTLAGSHKETDSISL